MAHHLLDAKDFKILAELDRDARQSNNQIGRKVGLSKEVVKYRIDKLIEEGVILRFHAIINYFKLGIVKHKLYLRLTNTNKEKVEEIAQYFHQNKKTEWVAITTGRWDLIIGFLVRNVNEFDDEIQETFNTFSDFIQEKAMTTTLYLAHQHRELTDGPQKNIGGIVYHTTKDMQEKIDETDEELLRLIANNARMPVTELAKRMKTTPRIVQYRLLELEKKEIILGYRAHLDSKALGKIFCKAIISLEHLNQESLKRFISYTSSVPGALWPQRVLGNWDFELDVETEGYDTFQDLLLNLKEQFPDIIRDHEFCIQYKEFKLDLYPGAYPPMENEKKTLK